MSRTLVQRFYEVAKLKAESPALGLEYGGAYHDLPWWFVKSKAKHFGMGLLEAGARQGEYFYLLASEDPESIYAELGALTVGLKTLPLPKEIPANALATLFRRFPPAFFFSGGSLPPLDLFRGLRGLHRILRISEEPIQDASLPNDSFRRVFNSGIRCEAKHHAAFRRLRESAEPTTELSPIRVDQDGLVRESPLNYGQVQEMCGRFDQLMGNRSLQRLLAQADLSRTNTRIACLYWPILKGAQAILLSPRSSFAGWLKRFRPEAILPPSDFFEGLSRALSAAPPPAPKLRSLGDLKRRWEARRLRHRLHLDSPTLIFHRFEDEAAARALAGFDIATFGLD